MTSLVKFDQKVTFLLFLVKNLKIRLSHTFFVNLGLEKFLAILIWSLHHEDK